MSNNNKKSIDFKSNNSIELVEYFINNGKKGIEKIKDKLLEYFNQMNMMKVVPFLFADYFSNNFFKDKGVGLFKFFDSLDLDEQEYFVVSGYFSFLDELLEKNYFSKGKANSILGALFSELGWANERLQDVVAQFLEDKDDIVQLILIDSLIDSIPPSRLSLFALLKAYENGFDYVKIVILNFFNYDYNLYTQNLETMLDILAVVSDDILGNNEVISHCILLLLKGWKSRLNDSQKNILTDFLYKKNEIIITDSMLNEAFRKDVEKILEQIKSFKNQNSKQD